MNAGLIVSAGAGQIIQQDDPAVSTFLLFLPRKGSRQGLGSPLAEGQMWSGVHHDVEGLLYQVDPGRAIGLSCPTPDGGESVGSNIASAPRR